MYSLKNIKPLNFIYNCPKQFEDGLHKYLHHLSQPRETPLIEKGGFKIAEKFGFRRTDFTDDDVRSYYDPDKLFEQLDNFGDRVPFLFDSSTLKEAVRQAVNQLGITRKSLELLPLDENLIEYVSLDKSAGLPSLEPKKNQFFYALNRAKLIVDGKKRFTPAIATVRTQRKKKTRLAWSMSFDSNLVEQLVYQPVMNNLGHNHPLLSKRATSVIASKLNELDIRYKYKIGIDYSQFDSRVPAPLIFMVFDELKKLFKAVGNDVEYLDRIFRLIANNFVHTVIMMPDGKLYKKERGVPSGSQLTSLVGSLCNLSMIRYYAIVTRTHMVSMVLGDDSAIFTNSKVNLHDWSKFMWRTFGMKVSVDKSSIRTSGVEVLGYIYHRGLRYEDRKKTLAKLIFPETYRKTALNYSAFLSNLVMEYSLTNQNLTTGLSDAIKVRNIHPEAFVPQGSSVDDVYYLKPNKADFYKKMNKVCINNVLGHALS